MIINQEIILIIIFIVIVYFTYQLNYFNNKINNLEKKTIEGFTDATTTDAINTAVKKIYLADVESIRILSNFAILLSQGGYFVPGPITFKEKVFTEQGLIMNNQKITIKGMLTNGELDPNHYIQSTGNDKYLTNNTIDGVRICGNMGGVLSTNNDGLQNILNWNKTGIDVSGNINCRNTLSVSNGLIMNGQKITIKGMIQGKTELDPNHYIQSTGNDTYLPNNTNIDGVRICGNMGGVLSTNNDGLQNILNWNKTGIHVNGNINCTNGLIMNDKKITIRSGGDVNHYINYEGGKFGTEQTPIDGVNICGNRGGVLSTNMGSFKHILNWYTDDGNNSGVKIQGNLNSVGNINSLNTISAGPNNDAFLNKDGTIFAKNGIRIGWTPGGNYEGVFKGTDNGGADYNKFNMQIRSYQGIGFVPSEHIENNEASIWFDVRTGTINCKKINIVDGNNRTVLSIDGNGAGGNGMATIEGDINSFGRIKCAGLWPRSSKTDEHSKGNPYDPNGCLIGWDSGSDKIFLQGHTGCKFQSTQNNTTNILGEWGTGRLNVNTSAKLNVIGLAGYVFDGMPNIGNPRAYPIICSMHHGVWGAAEADDAWLINPGYKVLVYQDVNYGGGVLQTFDNYNGEKAALFYKNSNQFNSTGSWKVYFNNDNNEVTVAGVS